MALQEQFAKAVIRLRNDQGLSQEKFALESGISSRYMTDIERGKRKLSLEYIEKIARGLKMKVSDLFAEVEKENNN